MTKVPFTHVSRWDFKFLFVLSSQSVVAAAVAVVVVVVVFAKANRTFEVLLMVALRVFSKGYHHFN